MYTQYFRERFETEIWAGITLSLALLFSCNSIQPFNVLSPKYNNEALPRFLRGGFSDEILERPDFIRAINGSGVEPRKYEVLIAVKTAHGNFWDQLSGGAKAIDLEVIKEIESDGNVLAFNSRTKCYGLYQISEICLEDFNQVCVAAYTPQDLFDPVVNEKIASWYFRRIEELLLYFKIPISESYLIAAYNWGVGNVVRWHREGALIESLPQETRNYIEKYKTLALNSSKNS